MRKLTGNDAAIVAEEALNRLGFYSEEMNVDRDLLKGFFMEWIMNQDHSLGKREALGVLKGMAGTLGAITLYKFIKEVL